MPLTGEPLQTQPIELPLPVNSYNPYVREEDSVEWGATAGALDVAEYWAAKHAAEGAEPKIEDPIFHYRAWEAKEKSKKLLQLVAAGDLTGALGTLFGTLAEFVDGYIEAHLTTEVVFTWLSEYGEFLGACAEKLHEDKDVHGGCRASYNDIGPVPDFWSKPVISMCLDGKANGHAIDDLELGDCARLAYHVPDSVIVTESWGGQGTPGGAELIEGSAVTTSTVAAVSINGGAPIPTRTESALPAGLRAVAVEIHLKAGPSPTRLPHFTPLNAGGVVIPQSSGQPQYASVDLPGTRGWKRPAPVAQGACRLTAAGLTRLSAQWGAVLTRISPYTGSVGRPFISCISTEFYLNNWPLLAGVLLDGGHPGTAPASLPAMSPLPGHPGIVVAPGAEGQMVARRIPRAWLVVDGGKDLRQRLTLLQHLRATIHL